VARLARRGGASSALTRFMFGTVFRWEMRALRRDPACWLALTLALAALVFALANGARWLTHLETIRAAAEARDLSARAEARAFAARLDARIERAPFVTRDPRNAYGYANNLMAHYAVVPATPLAALTVGQGDLLPSVVPLAPITLPSVAARSEPENPHRLLIGRFDAAFAVVFLVPLLIIALTYALLSGERERGTLALLLAQPVTLSTVFAAKFACRVLLVLGLLVLLTLGFALATPVADWTRLGLWLVVALAYAAFWFALSAAVIVGSGGSAGHAVKLAAAWLALTMLLPAAINLAVKTLAPVPSRIELILALRSATDAATAERSKVLAEFYEDHPELMPAGGATTALGDFVTLRLVTNQRIERDLVPVLARYEEQLVRQQALVDKLQFLSPALLAQAALADAAGTGIARHRWFFAQVLAHHAELRAFFNPRALAKEKFSAWDEVPDFRYVEEPTAAASARAVPALAALLLAALAFGLWSWRMLLRARLVT
jgi:ABC-2 type transport system permease protein